MLKPWQDEWYAGRRVLREGFGMAAWEVMFTKNGLIGLIKDERVWLSKDVYIGIYYISILIYLLINYVLSLMNTKMLMLNTV